MPEARADEFPCEYERRAGHSRNCCGGGEQQATRVQPKPLDLERNGSIYRAYRMQLREEAAAFATSSVLTHPR